MKNTVDYIFKWKENSKMPSVEDMHKTNKYVKDWEYIDVMYSFYGIYVIGLLVKYPNEFQNNGCTISLIDKKDIRLYDYVIKYYSSYPDLNNLKELNDFIEVYDYIGNLIPVWPGANEHRGFKSKCYDLPDVYFKRHSKWTEYLINRYPEAVIENLHKSSYPDKMGEFLELMKSKDEYEKFLTYVVNKIKYRTIELSR